MAPVSESTADGSSGGETSDDGAITDMKDTVYGDLTFTLYMRPGASTVTKERQNRIRERLEQCENDLGSLSVEQWTKEVTVTDAGESTDKTAVRLFEECTEAVEAVGGRLQPFFEENTPVSGFLSGTTNDRVLVFPVLGVTVRRDGELVGLFPCWIDGVHHSVGDCLDRIEAGEPVTNLD